MQQKTVRDEARKGTDIARQKKAAERQRKKERKY
jgi:hypothetical protein